MDAKVRKMENGIIRYITMKKIIQLYINQYEYNGLRAINWSELYKMIKNIKDTIEINKLIKQSKEVRGIKGWEF